MIGNPPTSTPGPVSTSFSLAPPPEVKVLLRPARIGWWVQLQRGWTNVGVKSGGGGHVTPWWRPTRQAAWRKGIHVAKQLGLTVRDDTHGAYLPNIVTEGNHHA